MGRRCGVLGDPVAHSLSPALHRAAYAELGLDWSYDAHRVPAGGLESFLAGLGPEWRGLSLTMPLKREALALADEVTDRARLAGAVNTLLLDDGATVGDNTDLPGAIAAVRERTTMPLASAVVLGGGATATSIGLALVELGVTSIELLVRDASRAQETVDALRSHPAGVDVRTGALDAADAVGADVVVSTIPAAAQTDDAGGALRRRAGRVRGVVRPVAHAARRRRAGIRPGPRRRARPAGAPGGAAARAVHRAPGTARHDAGNRRTRPRGAHGIHSGQG